ncbi:hypothetical protein HC026_08340 [Lactobacillus sp. LC28-10]|uniref:DUF2334 domain-containing protein n=1 Tax=Secundilactobacillus angelensis TaxID=2722706 RepID=A0ABX1L140_9LACO|nr:hypothetical protein [Secundilactobacillus angelensis]MCH5462011.1 hypothetical protein [Secundilactobacillus angelensis]NLR18933.1 hypothetical protein [Secundilactobacillus angelensis]
MWRKGYLWGFLLIILLLLGVKQSTIQAEAADQRPVMLVYDSKNIAEHGDLDLDCCQRLLTSLGLPVKTVQLSQYHAHLLETSHCQGVITMVNWAQVNSRNQAFERDRARFTGVKLHIGSGLQTDERKSLGGHFKTLVHQQLKVHQGQANQLLSTNKTLLVNDKRAGNAMSVGWLTNQNMPAESYSYGVKVGNAGFLPEIGTDGVSINLAGQLIAKLFKLDRQPQLPLLTITGVTPYTKMNHLKHLIDCLSSQGYPFALSIVSVESNTDLAAFHRYTKILRYAEKSGGVIFLSPSTETGTQRLNEAQLRSVFQTELASLGADRVLPIGVSAPGYWNRSQRRQAAVLSPASHVLLRPDTHLKLEEKPVEAEPVVTNSQVFPTSIVGIPFDAFETATYQNKIQFFQSTALLVKMPADTTEINRLMQRLQGSKLRWFDPVRDQLETSLKIGTVSYEYQAGQYLVNHQVVFDLDADIENFATDAKPAESDSWMNRVIQWQSHALLWLFAGIGLVLTGLLVLGWRIYRRKFIRNSGQKKG